MDEAGDSLTPPEQFDQTVDEHLRIFKTRQAATDVLRQRVELTGGLTQDVKNYVRSSERLAESREGLHWIDAGTDVIADESRVVRMIQLRDEYALQEREENAGRDGQKDSTAVNEDLALSIKERTTIARQSRMDLELRIQKLKDEGAKNIYLD